MEETLRILIVDDDEVDRKAVHRALTQAGVKMELCEASDGKEALLALKNTTYNCVFLDYSLPDQDGLTLIHQIHASEIKVPLVVLTAQGDEQIAVELMKAGATDYLSKSRLSSENLAQVLRNAIRVYRAEMQVNLAIQQLRESHEQLIQKNKKLEIQRQQIQIQNLKLIEASRLKTEFLATISHELCTPMNAIIGFSQILLRPKLGQLTHKQTDLIERILNNGNHLLLLLNEVLDFAKLETGKLELKPELFDLSTVVNATVAEMQTLAEIKKLPLLVEVNLENPWIFNDSVRVRQIVVNLLSNAIKFTEAGNIWVEVQELPGNCVAIAIRDTGIGIAPQQLKHIFAAFRQADQSISRKYPGTGLGLAIVDSLVQMMGGTILIESKLGIGSMFKIKLPRRISFKDESAKSPDLNIDGENILLSTSVMTLLTSLPLR